VSEAPTRDPRPRRRRVEPPPPPARPIDLETYYTEAGMDYRAWSRGFNMHFGFWRAWMNPFALERMLEQMSREVFARLALADGDRVLDSAAASAPRPDAVAGARVAVTAVTKVEWQIAMAHASPRDQPRRRRRVAARRLHGARPAGAAYQGAFSIEASCHAAGAAKEPFVREAAGCWRRARGW
jgi:hypothetical protein